MKIKAAGMVGPVGLTAQAACAAIRAGISQFDELPYWDNANQPIIGAAIPGLSLDLQFGPRLVEMLSRAIQDCLANAVGVRWQEVPLLIGLAEPGRPGGADLANEIVKRVEETVGVKFHSRLSQTIPKGHVAGCEGLRIARELFRTHKIPSCLICGVDSYINASSLFWLDQHWRLKRDDHTNGVIPGEAAAAVLAACGESDPQQTRPTAEVIGMGFGHEEITVFIEQPLRGMGLANAAGLALAEAGLGYHEVDFRIADLTGESYGVREHVLAEGRLTKTVRHEDRPIWHAADSIGDTGAAAGVIQLVLAASAWAKGYAPGDRAVGFTSSVAGERAVVAIRRSIS
jgi:3-oxoacyl-[acyl-carrier-protein] synthase-1